MLNAYLFLLFISDVQNEYESMYFSCYRTSTEPLMVLDMEEGETKMFDTCQRSYLIENLPNGLKILKTGKYRFTFTVLMKSTSQSSINLEILRKRCNTVKVIGFTGASIGAEQGEPQLGISTSVDMLEMLMENDIIEIKQSSSGNSSYLRSSDWNLVRLEGHLIDQDGLNCQISDNKIMCNDEEAERDSIKITESGMYEISLNGLTFIVSIKKRIYYRIYASFIPNKIYHLNYDYSPVSSEQE